MSVYGGPDIVENGLVLYLDAANRRSYPGSGTSWTDVSGNGNNGTLTNGPTFNSGNGGSIVFDGVNDHITTALTLSNILNASEEITICSWNFTTNASGGPLFSIQTDTNLFIRLDIANLTSSGFGWTPQLQWGRTGTLLFLGTGTYAYDINNWNYTVYMIKFTSGLQQVLLYNISKNTYLEYNTLSFGSIGTPTYTQTNQSLFIGRRTTSYFGGNIANTTVYNRVLTATEVLQNYNATRSRFGV